MELFLGTRMSIIESTDRFLKNKKSACDEKGPECMLSWDSHFSFSLKIETLVEAEESFNSCEGCV